MQHDMQHQQRTHARYQNQEREERESDQHQHRLQRYQWSYSECQVRGKPIPGVCSAFDSCFVVISVLNQRCGAMINCVLQCSVANTDSFKDTTVAKELSSGIPVLIVISLGSPKRSTSSLSDRISTISSMGPWAKGATNTPTFAEGTVELW